MPWATRRDSRSVRMLGAMPRRLRMLRILRYFATVRRARVSPCSALLSFPPFFLADDGIAIVFILTPPNSHLELRGNSRIGMSQPAQGGLQAMGARDINLNFADDGETIQHAILAGAEALQRGAPKGRIKAFAVEPDVTINNVGSAEHHAGELVRIIRGE